MLVKSFSRQSVIWRLLAAILVVCLAIGLIGGAILRGNAAEHLRLTQSQMIAAALRETETTIQEISSHFAELASEPVITTFAGITIDFDSVTNSLRESGSAHFPGMAGFA